MAENKQFKTETDDTAAGTAVKNYLPLEKRTGKLAYGLTNDYLFKVVFQSNEGILRSFIAALLDLDEDEITEIVILNSIIPGEAVDDKTVMLDIRLCLNGERNINLEMQVREYSDWKKRSVLYLCRLYSDLEKGKGYYELKPAHHIAIIDYNPDDIEPEFYSTYKLVNVRNGEVFIDDLTLSILNLRQIDKATDKDKAKKLDIWAKVFKAKTWEDLKMLENSGCRFITDISNTIYELTEEERIREQCRLRDERIGEENWFKGLKGRLDKAEADLTTTKTELKTTKSQLTTTKTELKSTKSQLTTTKTELKTTKTELAEKDSIIAELRAELAELKG